MWYDGNCIQTIYNMLGLIDDTSVKMRVHNGLNMLEIGQFLKKWQENHKTTTFQSFFPFSLCWFDMYLQSLKFIMIPKENNIFAGLSGASPPTEGSWTVPNLSTPSCPCLNCYFPLLNWLLGARITRIGDIPGDYLDDNDAGGQWFRIPHVCNRQWYPYGFSWHRSPMSPQGKQGQDYAQQHPCLGSR